MKFARMHGILYICEWVCVCVCANKSFICQQAAIFFPLSIQKCNLEITLTESETLSQTNERVRFVCVFFLHLCNVKLLLRLVSQKWLHVLLFILSSIKTAKWKSHKREKIMIVNETFNQRKRSSLFLCLKFMRFVCCNLWNESVCYAVVSIACGTVIEYFEKKKFPHYAFDKVVFDAWWHVSVVRDVA